MLTDENVLKLLEKAQAEEKIYNWLEATNYYQQAVNYYLDNELSEKAAECHKNLGYAHLRAADTVDTAEEYMNQLKISSIAYKNAVDIFKQLEKNSEALECQAIIYASNGFLATSDNEMHKAFDQGIKLFIESSEKYSKEGDQEGIARTLSQAAILSVHLQYCNIDQAEFREISKIGKKFAQESYEIALEIGNIRILAESFNAEVWCNLNEIINTNFKENEYWEEYTENFLLKCEKTIKIVEKYNDQYALSIVHGAAGCLYGFMGYQFIKNEHEQEEFMDKAFGFLEKALVFAKKARTKNSIILWIFLIDYYALYGSRINYLQNRILTDIKESLEYGKIYSLSFNVNRSFINVGPALYYTNSSERSFFTTSQRKAYAEKGILHAKEAMKGSSSASIKAWLYQGFVLAYSQLTLLADSKIEQKEYAQKMLQYAKQAEILGQRYEGGFPQAGSYSSLYKAYKTLAEIAKKKEDRITNLKKAIEAQKKTIEIAILSRTGALNDKLRLGLLLEELGIITGETEIFNQARETFLHTIKESVDRNFFSYEAASYQYLARIEDRLGNYNLSAESYKNAQEAYSKSLKMIKYKLLKNRINEKFNYVKAWRFIEEAKMFHKREDHLQSKEFYTKAHEILIDLRSYGYEASYYSGWISLEEAEQLSKLEKHTEAIESFNRTREIFEKAIGVLEKSKKKSREKFENERVTKLEKIAQVRMNHCIARINLEEARILGKQGEHTAAAEKFALASAQLRDICNLFKIKREREELEAVYYLCRAWEHMELAEKYEDPYRFSEAAALFAKASNLFKDTKLKLLASGNSTFCIALEYGCRFDESIEMKVKKDLYPKVKLTLSKAANSYEKGGFKSGADWAQATSIYFDAVWNLIKADEETDLEEKGKLLGIGAQYLKSAVELFGKAGYKEKENEVQDRLNRVEKEESILFSALSTIKEPSISHSTMGIVAPSCPIESSESPRLGEAQQFTEEERRQALKEEEKITAPPQLAIEQPVLLLIIAKGGVLLFSYPFTEDLKFDDEVISGFLAAFDSFSGELFSKGLDRAKFGDYSVVMDTIADYSVSYLFKGQIIPAKQKLLRFLDKTQQSDIIFKSLEKSFKTSQVLEINEVPALKLLINEIFIRKKSS
ncbi:MAG: hypothetical protein ACW98D_07505 [Promethearchaeota archaeon]|jgi:tetratricopeptide (TPR) repeat protein